jgi:hypothetical protein
MAIARIWQPNAAVMQLPAGASKGPVGPPDPSRPAGSAVGAGVGAPEISASAKTSDPDRAVIVVAVVAVLVGLAIVHHLSATKWDPDALDAATVIGDVSIFALLYVAAQSIERLLEPLSSLGFTGSKKAAERDLALAKKDGQKAADAQADLDRVRANRTVAFWGLSTVIGITASGWLKIYILHIIGLTSAPRVAEILVTGLAIAGGTKPLHDLISRIEKAKTNAQDPPETTTGT